MTFREFNGKTYMLDEFSYFGSVKQKQRSVKLCGRRAGSEPDV
jgi:hypothetical protein